MYSQQNHPTSPLSHLHASTMEIIFQLGLSDFVVYLILFDPLCARRSFWQCRKPSRQRQSGFEDPPPNCGHILSDVARTPTTSHPFPKHQEINAAQKMQKTQQAGMIGDICLWLLNSSHQDRLKQKRRQEMTDMASTVVCTQRQRCCQLSSLLLVVAPDRFAYKYPQFHHVKKCCTASAV